MALIDRELRKAIKLGVKALIVQEIRLLRLEHSFTPRIMVNEVSRSIQDTKREIAKLAKPIEQKDRAVLLKKMIRQSVDEEIDRAIELRKTRCIRCEHGRFYDEAGTAYVNLPTESKATAIGCDKLRPGLRKSCRRFVKMSQAASLEDYLNEMTLLYEFRELIERIEEVWKDYITN